MNLKDDISGEKKKRKNNSASKTKCKNKKPKKGQTKKEDLSFRDFEQMMCCRAYSRGKGGATVRNDIREELTMNQSNETFLERLCSKCPGTQWGKSSMCRIHVMHIGKITACQQWEEYQAAQLKDHNGQVAFLDLEPALEAVQRVEQDLRDYRWMAEKVQTLQTCDDYQKQHPREVWETILGAGTAQYGVESSLPKAKGVNSDVTYREAQKLLRNWERMKRYERKVKKLEEAVRSLKDERERTLAEGILDGEKLYQIAQQLNVSRTTVDTIRRSMVRNLAWALYEDEMREGLPA